MYSEETVDKIIGYIRENGPLDPDERKKGLEEPAVHGGEGSTPASGQ